MLTIAHRLNTIMDSERVMVREYFETYTCSFQIIFSYPIVGPQNTRRQQTEPAIL